MRNRIKIAVAAITLCGTNIPVNALPARSISPTDSAVIQSSTLLRGAIKCARNSKCRKLIAERANRLAKRMRELMTDLAMQSVEQLHELLGEIVEARHNKDVLAKLDRLEALLKAKGIYCAEIQREIEAIRALHQ